MHLPTNISIFDARAPICEADLEAVNAACCCSVEVYTSSVYFHLGFDAVQQCSHVGMVERKAALSFSSTCGPSWLDGTLSCAQRNIHSHG